MTDNDFRQTVSDTLRNLYAQFDNIDSDDLDNRYSEGVLQTDFETGGVFVLSQQVPVHELWLSAFSRAWHFKRAEDCWRERDTHEPLEAVLSANFTKRLGKPVKISIPQYRERSE